MRPLNRPMFKMGGPVKEGIMDGIKEPESRQGYFVGGVATNILARAAPFFTRQGVRSIGTGLATKPSTFQPATTGIMSKLPNFVQRMLPTGRFRQTTNVPGQGNVLTEAQIKAGMIGTPGKLSRTQALLDPKRLGMAIRENPFLAVSTPTLLTNTATIGFPIAGEALKGFANFLVPGERFDPFKGEKQDENVGQKSSTLGQRGKSGDTINRQTEKGNQFNDDGSKKETSVSRLLKAVEKRSRDAAVADSLIAAGEEIRTGGIDSDTVGNITQRVSKEFDKDVDLRQKLDLARIESELKKEQIAAQAIATDPVNIEIRKRKLTTIGDLDRADRGGVRYGVKGGIRLLAQDFEQLTGIQFQGSLGGDDELKRIADTEAFKLNPESVIKDSIENIKTSDGNIIVGENGTYMLGNQLYEYTNGVVKRLK